MVRSLAYWLEAAGIADVIFEGRTKRLEMSQIGGAVKEHDPYFEYPGTWWFVHLALASRNGSTPSWFFNDFVDRTFERATCVEAFLRFAKQRASKAPSPQTAQRDIANVLASYTYDPTVAVDPEDGTVCPLVELRLVTFHRDTRKFEKVRPVDPVPIEAVLAAASLCGNGDETLSVAELASRRNGPGRLFNLGLEAIDTAAEEGSRRYRNDAVSYALLGAERRLRAPEKPTAWWLQRYYERVEALQ
jgi:hypothetical protein